MTSDFEGVVYQILSITLFSYLISLERAGMLSAKQVKYWHHFYDAVLDWGLNTGPPALEASTVLLGYRGGGVLQ